MAKQKKTDAHKRPVARLPKGMRDIGPAELRETQAMLDRIRAVYERYGFEPLETPAFEYTDALGKFLPDQDRPNAGVFSFQDDDEAWLSLRYDLTAPLARYVAQNFQSLALPFRRYATGPVFRNEKPGPGRFCQFTQFDADTVGAESVAADAEMCMLAADAIEALGIPRGQYVIKVSNRKVLDGVMEAIGIGGDENTQTRLDVLRAIDKQDRLGLEEVKKLLTVGRTDTSGDKMPGANLSDEQADKILASVDALVALVGVEDAQKPEVRKSILEALQKIDKKPSEANTAAIFSSSSAGTTPAEDKIYRYLGVRYFDDSQEVLDAAALVGETGPTKYAWGEVSFPSDAMTLSAWRDEVVNSQTGLQGIAELQTLLSIVRRSGYGPGRIILDPSVVRGLEYYTGPVFEAELLMQVTNEDGQLVRFGAVGGGGRYDGLIERFLGQKVPATGFAIGVSRLQAALAALGKLPAQTLGPVVVTVMDKAEIPRYQKMVQELRNADIRAELYLGNPKKFGRQLEYADKRGAPCVIIQGGDERAKGEVQIKDLIEGAKAAAAIKDNAEWKASRPAQISVPEADLVKAVRDIIARHAPAAAGEGAA